MDQSELIKVSIINGGLTKVEGNNDSNYIFSGLEGRYLDVVLKALNKRFEIVAARDREWGSPSAGGNWTGMIGMVQRGDAHLAFNSLSITSSRFSVVDFSSVYSIDDMTFRIKKPGTLPPSLALIRPFDSTIWIAIIITLLLMPFLMKCLLNAKDTYINIFLKFLGSLLNESTITNRYFSRNIVASWLVFGMILTLSYSAILLSVLTVPLQMAAVKNFEELSEAVMKRGYQLYVPKGSSIIDFLINSDKKHLKFLGETALRNNWYSGNSDVYQCSIQTDCAMMTYRNLFQIMAGPENWKIYYMSEDSLMSLSFAFAMGKGFRYKKQLNTIISRASSAGIYNKFVNDESYKYLLHKSSTMYVREETKAFTVSDLLAKCRGDVLRNFTDSGNDCDDICKPSCQSVRYDISLSKADWPNLNHQEFVMNRSFDQWRNIPEALGLLDALEYDGGNITDIVNDTFFRNLSPKLLLCDTELLKPVILMSLGSQNTVMPEFLRETPQLSQKPH
ncbi:hypothetical protein AVEN_269549-1 [Araneus ventricosus]|uniref:Ionotropic glutamate receptor L-glutamate and glycine-binding domain-containing protein n=1 Tax=Araneus ventricosus TaxID=182803 RepID=A0A4Y2CDP4_ARAVE|nr:hypothetical protein AVEN_269549-1 [Araneus ventricosus]